MFGILNIAKPTGVTSRDVVNHAQRVVRPAKVGHAGTLDPLANGVLVVCVGPATRLIEYVQRMRKCYRGTFLLGRESDTEDTEGRVTELNDPPIPDRAAIETVLPHFVGTIQQRPPAYSALKVKGRRAHDLARRGVSVELAPRPVNVHQMQVAEYDYPRLVLEIICGSGTYIRSLGRDLAGQLETAAVMSALTRTAVGGFTLDDAVTMDAITRDSIGQLLLPPLRAVEELRHVTLNEAELGCLRNGSYFEDRFAIASRELAALDGQGRLVAVLEPRGGNQLGTSKNFAAARQS